MKPIRYALHARERMAERKISTPEVETVLRRKAIDVPGRKGRRKASDYIRGRRVTVVYKETAAAVLVISVM